MILTALRKDNPGFNPGSINKVIISRDEDYQTAEMIGNKMILHMAQAYQLIKGTQKIEQPNIKPLDQKQILLSLLPEEFESKRLVEEAKLQGVPPRTAARWNETWVETGLVQKIRQGHYKKIIYAA